MRDNNQTCKDCQFWEFSRKFDNYWGNCKINPPVVIPYFPAKNEYDPVPHETVFPKVGYDDWCGQFKTKEDKQ